MTDTTATASVPQRWTLGPNHPDYGRVPEEPKARRAYRRVSMEQPRRFTLAPGQWSKNYDRCQECGTNERRYGAHGLCTNCYSRSGPVKFWSRKYEACVECGTTERRHNGQGRCIDCYIRRWRTARAS